MLVSENLSRQVQAAEMVKGKRGVAEENCACGSEMEETGEDGGEIRGPGDKLFVSPASSPSISPSSASHTLPLQQARLANLGNPLRKNDQHLTHLK